MLIVIPALGIGVNIVAYTIQRQIVSDDVFVVVAVPEIGALRIEFAVAIRGEGFEPLDEIGKRKEVLYGRASVPALLFLAARRAGTGARPYRSRQLILKPQ